MDTGKFIAPGKALLPLLCIIGLLLLICPMRARADASIPGPDMQSYCNEPPFAATGTPNLLLMIDNSASMYDLAYTDSSSYCLDNSYQDGNSYSGYFEQRKFYRYDGTKFVLETSLPVRCSPSSSSPCAASTDYLYVEMADAEPPATTRTVSIFKASGNFLNWLSMSKFDIEKQVLTGGKFLLDTGSTTHGVLQGETRGCQGKRFVKMIGDDAKITFAVRGSTASGGATTIEIYDKVYNRVSCLNAVQAWLVKDKEGLIAQTNACLGLVPEVRPPPQNIMPGNDHISNRIMSDCYFYFVDKVVTASDATLTDECTAMYKSLTPTYNWDVITGICGNNLPHTPRSSGRVNDTTGFLGKCLDPYYGGNREGCLKSETADFCNEIIKPSVTDPSATANMAGTGANLPNFVLDAGITHLGTAAGIFNARVNHCRLKTSLECSFNSDCPTNDSCDKTSYGGKIISYINDPVKDAASPVGDHVQGLIADIDGVTANAWTPLAESFYNAIGYFAGRTDLRLHEDDFLVPPTKPRPSQFSCQKNNVLIVSDGMSMADSDATMESLASSRPNATAGWDSTNRCPPFEGSRSLDDLAWLASHRNIKTFSQTSFGAPVTQEQSITTHVIFTGTANGTNGECDPATLMLNTATNGGGAFAGVSDPNAIYGAFSAVLRQVADGTTSGTDASILSSGNGNGALFLQELYYPKKSFDGGDTSASWIGEMKSLWYYIDPFIGSTGGGSTIREDTDSDQTLNLKQDRVVQLQDNAASLFLDTNGDGNADGATQTVSPDAVKALWRAGTALWQRGAEGRTIYTQTDGSVLTSLSSLNTDSKAWLLQAKNASEALQITSYVAGVDSVAGVSPSYRNRTLRIPDTVPGVDKNKPTTNVWKLGDIISSTPKVQSPTALNSYNLPAPGGYGDLSYRSFAGSNEYLSRGTVYVGANDGMLHAFNMGKLDTRPSGDVKAALGARVQGETKADLGKERWAFIPKNALPYLTYLKEPSYRHLYYVDGAITLADVSIGVPSGGGCAEGSYWNCSKPPMVVKSDNSLDPAKNTWRTVVIGGMGLGGASCDTGTDCVPTPTSDPSPPSKRLGYSSYFALDVTDPDIPKLLWEFSHPDLGYSTTGPAIVRVGGPEVNGRWFAVFGSGPTGPIVNGQFLGHSSKELQFFVVDLRTGALVAIIPTGITYAFAGSMNGGALDDRWKGKVQGKTAGEPDDDRELYQDDAIYVGYVAKDAAQVPPTWTRGGVGRIMIADLGQREPTDTNVASLWHWSRLIGYDPLAAPNDSTGPVTTSISRLQDKKNKNLWLYFGSGRYYYRSTELDDWSGVRSIYGIKEPCYNNKGTGNYLDKYCSDPVCPSGSSTGCLADQSNSISEASKGWRINLYPHDDSTGNGAERVITNPVATTAGAVFFTTFQPSRLPCQIGHSYLWGVRYGTGDAIPDGSIKGKVLVQLSTGSVQEIGLSGGLTARRSPAMIGRPGGIKVVSNSGLRPLKRIIHIQER